MTKRELVQNVFEGKAGDRVPVGFWWHFVEGSKQQDAAPQDGGMVAMTVGVSQ